MLLPTWVKVNTVLYRLVKVADFGGTRFIQIYLETSRYRFVFQMEPQQEFMSALKRTQVPVDVSKLVLDTSTLYKWIQV